MSTDFIPNDISPNLIDRFLAGEATSDEREQVSRWADTNAHNSAFLREASELNLAGARTRRVDTAQAWQRVNPSARNIDAPRSTQHATRRWIGVSSLAALTIAALIFVTKSEQPNGVRQNETVGKTYVTRPGQKATVTLDDGSRIILAPGSRLTAHIPDGRAAGERRMEIDGQAMFVVVHDTRRPFSVKSGNTVTRVLGTSFVVRKYSDDMSATVVVTEGKVSVAQSIVVAGQGLQFQDNQQVRVLSDREIATSVEWTAGRLTFDETPIPQALKELSRWYGVEFRLDDPALAAGKLTAALNGDALTPSILSVLSEALGRNIQRNGPVVVISSVR